eukprot:101081-Pyramimonas_sp.AAC.1
MASTTERFRFAMRYARTNTTDREMDAWQCTSAALPPAMVTSTFPSTRPASSVKSDVAWHTSVARFAGLEVHRRLRFWQGNSRRYDYVWLSRRNSNW